MMLEEYRKPEAENRDGNLTRLKKSAFAKPGGFLEFKRWTAPIVTTTKRKMF
jgi:hypothetical protein